MQLTFTEQQVQLLYTIIGKAQITGQTARAVVELQTVIEGAVKESNRDLKINKEDK